MYYRVGLGERGIPVCVCYAESSDGIHWDKPELNLCEFEGSAANNIVWQGVGAHTSFGAFKDVNPDCQPKYLYKAVTSKGYNEPVHAVGSSDAIHWELIQESPVLDEFNGAAAAYDSHFCCWWDQTRDCYVMFHRAWYRPVEGKVRSIAIRTSPDFVHWTPLQLLEFGDTPYEDLYTSAVTRYHRAPHILLSFPKRFMRDRRAVAEAPLDGVSDAVFMSSRDGVHFDRRFMEAFVRPGRDRLNWASRTNMIASGILPIAPDELSIYISQHYNSPSAHLKRCVLRTDGFVSVNASCAGGELLTKAMIFDGRELVINYATSAAGSVRVELADQEGKAIPGFEADVCPRIYVDDIERALQWKDAPSLAAHAERPVRLRFLLEDADLYSLRFRS